MSCLESKKTLHDSAQRRHDKLFIYLLDRMVWGIRWRGTSCRQSQCAPIEKIVVWQSITSEMVESREMEKRDNAALRPGLYVDHFQLTTYTKPTVTVIQAQSILGCAARLSNLSGYRG